ncbi:spore germination protein GerM [Gracilibacillus halophilus YIM-C55.5]|uniref:Spore germination protein GerM n=1 Tax=Gracilibacillus halophilus YIM-C55.5 TaxID=1308866 RepID=N4WA42_9BACI|nr:GerMN domain-containing protein [Gracilibacillus halophilus]ENH96124.1 spore germination protein GerM [Gracilibacillus halophilus YIM-C55.5]
MGIGLNKKWLGMLLVCLLILSGCGVFQGEQTLEEIDAPPEDADWTDENLDEVDEDTEGEDTGVDGTEEAEEGNETEESEASSSGESATNETVTRTLYLLDENGLVVPHQVDLPAPESKEVAEQVLNYLVKDGPITSMLPSGFQAVLPSGTEVMSLNLEADGTLVVDVSEEFKSYQAENEKKILEAMTYTLTQFENVDRMKLWINGHEQNTMPVNGTPIQEGYSREDGINVQQTSAVDFMESKATTLYFPMQKDEQVYFVPITQHVEMNVDNQYQSVVQALLNGPNYQLPLQHVVNTGSELAQTPVAEDGVLRLTFNENILSNSETGVIADEVMQSIVLTMTEQEGIDAVEVMVDDVDQVINENGQPYNEPVSRDMVAPTESI